MPDERGPLSPALAVAFTTVGFFALVVAGFGMLSLLTDDEVLDVPGLGQLPGVVATAFAVAAYALLTGIVVAPPRPAFALSFAVVAPVFLAYLAGLVVGAMIAGVDLARAVGAVGGFATSWFAALLASAALVCAWAAIALVRTRAERPRWPWEDDEESDPPKS